MVSFVRQKRRERQKKHSIPTSITINNQVVELKNLEKHLKSLGINQSEIDNYLSSFGIKSGGKDE